MSAASAHCMLPLRIGDSSFGSMPEGGELQQCTCWDGRLQRARVGTVRSGTQLSRLAEYAPIAQRSCRPLDDTCSVPAITHMNKRIKEEDNPKRCCDNRSSVKNKLPPPSASSHHATRAACL